jgi:hypothetical protein
VAVAVAVAVAVTVVVTVAVVVYVRMAARTEQGETVLFLDLLRVKWVALASLLLVVRPRAESSAPTSQPPPAGAPWRTRASASPALWWLTLAAEAARYWSSPAFVAPSEIAERALPSRRRRPPPPRRGTLGSSLTGPASRWRQRGCPPPPSHGR